MSQHDEPSTWSDTSAVFKRLKNLTAGLSYCDDCEQPACVEDGQHEEGPHVLCHDCAVKHKAALVVPRCGTCRYWISEARLVIGPTLPPDCYRPCENRKSPACGHEWPASFGCPHHARKDGAA